MPERTNPHRSDMPFPPLPPGTGVYNAPLFNPDAVLDPGQVNDRRVPDPPPGWVYYPELGTYYNPTAGQAVAAPGQSALTHGRAGGQSVYGPINDPRVYPGYGGGGGGKTWAKGGKVGGSVGAAPPHTHTKAGAVKAGPAAKTAALIPTARKAAPAPKRAAPQAKATPPPARRPARRASPPPSSSRGGSGSRSSGSGGRRR